MTKGYRIILENSEVYGTYKKEIQTNIKHTLVYNLGYQQEFYMKNDKTILYLGHRCHLLMPFWIYCKSAYRRETQKGNHNNKKMMGVSETFNFPQREISFFYDLLLKNYLIYYTLIIMQAI